MKVCGSDPHFIDGKLGNPFSITNFSKIVQHVSDTQWDLSLAERLILSAGTCKPSGVPTHSLV